MSDRLLTRLVRSAGVWLAAAGQHRAPFRSPTHWQRAQDRAARRMARYAWQSVPFYRDAMRSAGIDPGDIRTAADFTRFPLIDRTALAADPGAFRSRAADIRSVVRLRSSGTTGQPAEFWHDRRSMLLNIAYGRRERAVLGAGTGHDTRPVTVIFRFGGSELRRVRAFYRRALLVPGRAERTVFADTAVPIEDNVHLLHRLRPRWVSAPGSYLGRVLLHPDTLRPGGWRPAAAFYTGESAPPADLRRLRDEEGILVQTLYRSAEALKIAFSCEEQDGMHIHPDLVHLSIVDETGRRLPPGEPGDIVLSNLMNRATVLLNYRIGDRGVLADAPCPCGRTFPLLQRLEGRTGHVLRLPCGRVVENSALEGALNDRDDVARYQIVQTGRRFEIRIRPAAGAELDAMRPEIEARYRRLLGDVPIRVSEAALEVAPGRKHRPVVVRRSPAGAEG